MVETHTEGPWEVHSSRNGRGETLTIFAPRAGKTGRPLAKIISKVFGAKNAAADARLMAAAPEMLAALRPIAAFILARDAVDSDYPDDTPLISFAADFRGEAIRITYGQLRAAVAAIVKAEGRS